MFKLIKQSRIERDGIPLRASKARKQDKAGHDSCVGIYPPPPKNE